MKTKLNQTDAQGLRQGLWERYWPNGNLWWKGSYLNGKQTGLWEWHWSNGNLWYKGSFLNGKEIGTWEWYDENETLQEVIYHH